MLHILSDLVKRTTFFWIKSRQLYLVIINLRDILL